MPKFQALTNNTLKEILRAHDLPSSGNKAELIQRLVTELETDEIEASELNSLLPRTNDDIQTQVDEIQRKLDQVVTALAAQQNARSNNERNR